MSAIRPHSKRLRSRSSSVGMFRGERVGGEDDLLLARVERVEGVEELLLRPLLVGQELHVVDQQHVDRAVALAEVRHAVEADRVDQLVDELLGGQVEHPQLRPGAQDLMADGVQQVGLAEAHAAVEEERVVALRRVLGDGLGGGVGELVGLAHDERAEQVLRVEVGRGDGLDAPTGCSSSREKSTSNRRRPEPGERPVDGRPVALLQGMEEAGVRGEQDEPLILLVAHLQGPEPGREFLGIELVLKLPLKERPERLGHETSVG